MTDLPKRRQKKTVNGSWWRLDEKKENNMADYIVRATAAEGQIRAFASNYQERW